MSWLGTLLMASPETSKIGTIMIFFIVYASQSGIQFRTIQKMESNLGYYILAFAFPNYVIHNILQNLINC